MKPSTVIASLVVSALTLSAGCKPAESSPAPAASPAPTAPAAQPARPAAVVPAAAVEAPAVDPRWPRWMPPIPGVRVRMGSRDFVEGGADRASLELLVASRQACERAGYAVSQTEIRRTRWDQKLIFTCTRADELIRVELTGQPARPNYTSFNACNGDFARTMMRRTR